MAVEQTLRGEPTRHIPYTLYNYVIQGCHVRVFGKHVRSVSNGVDCLSERSLTSHTRYSVGVAEE